MDSLTYSVTVSCPESQQDDLITLLWELGTTGVTQERDWVRAFFTADDVPPDVVLMQLGVYPTQIDQAAGEENWSEEWMRFWEPFAVGERFYLVPPWHADTPPASRLRINLRPGMACGSGLHPCTRLCLGLMESAVLQDRSLLDVGTGSGILAEGAHLLGARPVIACDIDPEATSVARQNLAGSGWSSLCFTGSLRSVRTRACSTVVANLNAVALRMIAPELRRVCSGVLIVSGFREDELTSVVQSIGLPLRSQAELEGWSAAVFEVADQE